jgi:hypothetical protein
MYPERKDRYFSGTGVVEGRLPDDPLYDGKLLIKDAYTATVPGFKYYSKSYGFTKSKVYPSWMPGLSYNHNNSHYGEGREGCGNDDKIRPRRLVSTAHELKEKPHYDWTKYNYVPPDKFFFKYWNV